MNYDDHAKGVGAIITNLQSLETVIRLGAPERNR
jgi:hypothetical protein